MSDLDALLSAVLDRPDDDLPRLVYADALDDLGDADRAAFVRSQVEAARAAAWEPAAIRARRLDPPPDGLPALPLGLDWTEQPYRRGFPAVVEAQDGAAFVAGADRLFELAPIEVLELDALPAGDVAALAGCPGLARIRRLVVREGFGQATARGLLDSPHLSALEELVVGAGLTSGPTARAVVGSRAFRRLRSFAYRDEERGGSLVAALAGLADPPPLRELDLRGNRLTPDGLRRLFDSPLAAGLESLDISDNHVGAGGFLELVVRDRLPALRRLDAARTGPGAGVAALAQQPLVSRLRWLNLGGNALGPDVCDTMRAMLQDEIRELDLSENRIGDAGVTQLLRAKWLAGLLQLDLSENGVTATGVEALIAARELDGLLAFDLGGNPIQPPQRQALRERFGDRVSF